MEAAKIINAVFGYLEMNMLPSMNDFQETAFYYAKEVMQEEANQIVDTAKDNLALRILLSCSSLILCKNPTLFCPQKCDF